MTEILSSVVGIILAGIAVGPSWLGLVTYTDFVSSLAHLGAVVLLFTVGLHFKLKEITNFKNFFIALIGIIVPWIAGYYLAIKITKSNSIWTQTTLGNWIKTVKEFSQFIYLGKEKPTVTLTEFFKIEQELASNPIQVKKGIHEDLQEQRKEHNQKPLSKPTFYRAMAVQT